MLRQQRTQIKTTERQQEDTNKNGNKGNNGKNGENGEKQYPINQSDGVISPNTI